MTDTGRAREAGGAHRVRAGDEAARAAVAEQVIAALEGSPRRALFVTELALLLDQRGSALLGEALADLRRTGRVLLADHPPPDRHLSGSDLRIVAGPLGTVPPAVAERGAELLWSEWWTGFASSHRCG